MKRSLIVALCVVAFGAGFLAGFITGIYVDLDIGNQRSDVVVEGIITRIVDGDTIYIDDERIRLSLIDAPEIGEQGFEEATSFLASLCPVGSIVELDVDDGQPVDDFGRTLGVVYCNGRNLNSELWRKGYARLYSEYLSDSEFSPHREW